MRMLNDHPLTLPYTAAVPWPLILRNGQPDWIESIYIMEDWLSSRVGPHYTAWVWSMWTLHQSHMCAVSFALERDTTLFLLRWRFD
jgi:hypothetical protein